MKQYTATYDEKAKAHVINVPATLVTLATSADRTNSNNTPFGLSVVDVDYGNGSIERVTAITWGKSLEKGVFDGMEEGARVGLRINVDGEYAGLTTLQLAGGRIDISKFAIVMPEGAEVGATV